MLVCEDRRAVDRRRRGPQSDARDRPVVVHSPRHDGGGALGRVRGELAAVHGSVSESAVSFDYEAKKWGAARLRPRPWFMNGLKLRYLLSDLSSVHGRVLDVGCGAGQVAKAVKGARPDMQVFACDVSRSALEAASASPDGVDFRLATAERLPFPDGEFDFVWIFDVLEHVEDPESVLREVARVLKPDAGFHIVLPLEGQPRTLYRLVGPGTRWTAKGRHGGGLP